MSNMIVASDGIVTAAVPIPDAITMAVHTKLLITAVEQCGEDISLTQQDDCLLVKSGEFEARIPAIPLTDVPQVFADAPACSPQPRLLEALRIAGGLSRSNSPKMAYSTILLNAGAATATDGSVIVQAWHGDLTLPRMIVPAAFLRVLAKAPAALYRLGYTADSLTVWFEDGAWLKCQLYPANSKLPNYNSILDSGLHETAIPLSSSIFDVSKKLKKTKANKVWFMQTRAIGDNGMNIECHDGPLNSEFAIDDILAVEEWAKAVAWEVDRKKEKLISHFFGAKNEVSVRGAVVHVRREA